MSCPVAVHSTIRASQAWYDLPYLAIEPAQTAARPGDAEYGLEPVAQAVRRCPICGGGITEPVRRRPRLAVLLPFGHLELENGCTAVTAYEWAGEL